MSNPRICIIGLKCYDLLAGIDPPRYIGGIESQLTLLACTLARRGHDVSMVVLDHGQPDTQTCSGVRTLKAFDCGRGWPRLRFVHPRWTGLSQAMARADADVYYQSGAGCETGQAAWWCRRHGRPFIFGVASDGDCRADLPALPRRHERVLYRYGLAAADFRLAQTEQQQVMLQEQMHVHSLVVPWFCQTPAAADKPLNADLSLLWVGRIAPVKRPELLLELANLLPEFTFHLVGEANGNDAFARDIKARAATISNIRLHGKLAPQQVAERYRASTLLVNTSRFEGFPVTFLEAWSHGLPVATIFDPDGVVAANGLGIVAADAAELAEMIRGLLNSPDRLAGCADAARRYFQSKHSVEAVAGKYERIVRLALAARH